MTDSLAVRNGYSELARAVIDVSLEDLKRESATKQEAIYFFESGEHFSLFCNMARLDQDVVYQLYRSLIERKGKRKH